MLSGPASPERVSDDLIRASQARKWPFTAVLRLFRTRVTSSREEEGAVAAAALVSFDYGGTRVGLGDSLGRVLCSGEHGIEAIERAQTSEKEACLLLERLGAVDASCLDDLVTDATCDYLIHPFGSASDRCAFTAAARGELERHGWKLEIDADYPYQITPDDRVSWTAAVMPDEELPGWFTLELGVVVLGRRIDLLPVVLDFVDTGTEDEDLKSIARRLHGSVSVRISETHNLRVPVERFRALLRVVIELYQGARRAGPKIRFPMQSAPSIARVAEWIRGCPGKTSIRDREGVIVRGRKILETPAPVEVAPSLRATLRPYQQEGVAFLQHLRSIECGAVLADDMGLGKTLQTIAHLCTEKDAGRLALPALIVTPTSLTFNWSREFERFAPHLRILVLKGPGRREIAERMSGSDVVISTYPVLVRDVDSLEQSKFSTVVLDEAQAIKNARSQTHRALSRIYAEHRICLSGTPVENDLGELWALFDFIEPGLLGNEPSFRHRFRGPIETRGDETRLEALRDLVGPHMLRRNKRDVAPELPEKTDIMCPVELVGKQRELYEQIRVAAHSDVRQAIRKKGLAASTLSILDAIMKLRQVCCDPRLVGLDQAREVTESAKYEALLTLIETEVPQGRRILVFSQFTSMLALIAKGLDEKGMAHAVLTGQTRDRRAAVDQFESGHVPIFLISLKAGGTGLNLVSADTVVHYDPWWNPASQTQATDRAYRIGQTKPVFVHHLFVSGSVEERVLMLQRRKAWLAGAVLGEPVRGPAAITELDVERLLSPLNP